MPAQEFICKVESFRSLTPTVFETTFTTDKPLDFKAGQFVSVIVPGAGPKGRDLRRAYSIASAPSVRPIELCVKLVEGGPGTNYLFKLRPGDTFRGFAPYGDFVLETPPTRHACLIATGTGIAPFKAMVESEEFLAAPPKSTLALLGVRSEDELLYLDSMAKSPLITFKSCVSQPSAGWQGFRGRVTDALREAKIAWAETDFYLCGNGSMIAEVKSILEQHGVAKEAIITEKYY